MNKDKPYFECAGCGFCCQGETTVSLTPEDLKRMASYLKISEDALCNKYLRVTSNIIQMKIVDGHCIFYKDGCTIHPGKPWRCSQWPLHPSILQDKMNFDIINESCPGFNKDLDYVEFCRQMKNDQP